VVTVGTKDLRSFRQVLLLVDEFSVEDAGNCHAGDETWRVRNAPT